MTYLLYIIVLIMTLELPPVLQIAHVFLQIDEGEPTVMWLSGLHIPESYLTALVQATCRKNGWPLDRSTLYTQVTKYHTAEEVTERSGQGTHHSLYTVTTVSPFLPFEIERPCEVTVSTF